ncbi:MAG TPA: Rrf2 family transcriptional regulator [Anaerolineaceae bacterium]|nr:Rrf2 family transcriptional regulator [Anaerolineaceae bacterium]HUM49838.1 Rrf2 family transcriptional regulator [Anaerolineaceae bacterium]
MSMQITNQADYALRSMLYIAQYAESQLIPSNKIAEEMQISRIFLSRINSQLVNAGLIRTRRGARGGVMLAKPAADISVYDVVTTIDGPITLIDCIADPESCPLSPDCPYRTFWEETQNALIARMKAVSLQDMAASSKKIGIPLSNLPAS